MTEITQADRDAAAAIVYEENKDGIKWASAKAMRDHVAAGKWDWHPTVQAFARHRELAIAEIKRERDQAVEALRLFVRLMNDPDYDLGELCEEFCTRAETILASIEGTGHDD